MWQDARLATRLLTRESRFAVTLIALFAVCIGANTAAFSILNAAVLRPLPVPRPAELFNLHGQTREGGFSYPDFVDYRRERAADMDVASHVPVRVLVGSGQTRSVVWAQLVSPNYFRLLDINPAIGRVFSDDVAGADGVVIASGLWKRLFDSAPDVANRTIELNGHRVPVLGVMSPEFNGTVVGLAFDLWAPASMDRLVTRSSGGLTASRAAQSFDLIARIRPEVDAQQAAARLAATARELDRMYPLPNGRTRTVRLEPANHLHPAVRQVIVPFSTAAAGALAIVLLIACANAANLLYVRGEGRLREYAMRTALGASRSRIARQFVVEVGCLTAIAGIAGLLVASWTRDLLPLLMPPTAVPYTLNVRLDANVLWFALAACIAVSLIAGLAPAIRFSRSDLVQLMQPRNLDGARTPAWRRRQQILLGVQIALACAILVPSGLFIRSAKAAGDADLGFDYGTLAIVDLPDLALFGADARRDVLYAQLLARLAETSGVRSAALVQDLPLDVSYGQGQFQAASTGNGTVPVRAGVNIVDSNYLATLGIPLRHGRGPSPHDREGTEPVAIVNETLARMLWADSNAVGEQIVQLHSRGEQSAFRVVGIVGDTRYFGLAERHQPFVFLPYQQHVATDMKVVVRMAHPSVSISESIQTAAQQVWSDLPVRTKTFNDHLGFALWPIRTGRMVFSFFAIVAVGVALFGTYAVVSHAATRRRREVAIRVALGAPLLRLSFLLVREYSAIVGIGIGGGLLLAPLLTQRLERYMYQTDAGDPVTLVGVAVILAAVTSVACYMPARRATRLDPMATLRAE